MEATNRNGIFWLSIGAILAAITVGLGAFGAHGLESAIEGKVEDPVKNIGYWETAIKYQMFHCIGILLAGLSIAQFEKKLSFSFAASCFLVGIVLFCGLLFVMTITDIKILGAIVPLGGLAMIIGWIALAVGFWTTKSASYSDAKHGS